MQLRVENLSHIYFPGSQMEVVGIQHIFCEIREGEFIGLIGPTGSGKSTFVQHLNGLLKPTAGRILIDGRELTKKTWREVRQRVGLIFQYPEHQLFEETVFDDIAFGPRNMRLPEEQVQERVSRAAAAVGLDPAFLSRSPFELSGGQTRRVAIAGVLAMEPELLILDEPTAGLDPRGRREILSYIKQLHQERGLTVLLVTHSMEDAATLADRLFVMDKGQLVMTGTPGEVFAHAETLQAIGLQIPQMAQVLSALAAKGLPVKLEAYTVADAAREILRALGRKTGGEGGCHS
ncbi:MAG TPA: energy-coupling factor transporter ATPase [Firmicutes bacterium]|jgi:energy-coupling factor transport system ATP-binding protein|nr:energy-coupling factor transporter ATPase [Bacillota bacterium]